MRRGRKSDSWFRSRNASRLVAGPQYAGHQPGTGAPSLSGSSFSREYRPRNCLADLAQFILIRYDRGAYLHRQRADIDADVGRRGLQVVFSCTVRRGYCVPAVA